MQRLLRAAHALARDWWDPGQRLLVHPDGIHDGRDVRRSDGVGLVAPTVWWAHGLLRRAGPGDRELAEVAVRSVVDRQLIAVGRPWHATWPRTSTAVDGDPAWRVVVGTALALVLRDHQLPEPLARDARAAVGRAVRADRDRVVAPTATTEAVHRAWLELEVGRWWGDEDLLAIGAERARAVAADAGVRGHVAEHVGPTATGTVLLGLSLWAQRAPVDDLGPLGRALRDEVWHDLLAVWHPGLRSLVPPFTQATGMDLRTHIGVTGLWLAWLIDGVAPVPPLHEPPLEQAHDLPLVFLVDALAAASEDVRALGPLVRAQPARQGGWYDRVGDRVWTGWTGADLAVGAAWTLTDAGDDGKAVRAAAIWRADGDHNAWMRLHQSSGPVEARVEHDDGEVRLVHGTTQGPVELWLGGEEVLRATPSEVVHGGRTWAVHGVADVVRVDGSRAATGAWRLVPTGDGIVLATRSRPRPV